MFVFRVEVRNENDAIIERVLVVARDITAAHERALKQLSKEYKPTKLHASSIERLPDRVI